MAELNLDAGRATSSDIAALANAITSLQQTQIQLQNSLAEITQLLVAQRQPLLNNRGALFVDTSITSNPSVISGYRNPYTGATIDASMTPADNKDIKNTLNKIFETLVEIREGKKYGNI